MQGLKSGTNPNHYTTAAVVITKGFGIVCHENQITC